MNKVKGEKQLLHSHPSLLVRLWKLLQLPALSVHLVEVCSTFAIFKLSVRQGHGYVVLHYVVGLFFRTEQF